MPDHVKACPRCGYPYMVHCYHEGRRVQSVEMPVSKAIELARHELKCLESDAEKFRVQIEKYQEMQDA